MSLVCQTTEVVTTSTVYVSTVFPQATGLPFTTTILIPSSSCSPYVSGNSSTQICTTTTLTSTNVIIPSASQILMTVTSQILQTQLSTLLAASCNTVAPLPSDSPSDSPTQPSYQPPQYVTPTGSPLPSGSVPTQTAVASGPPPDLSQVRQLWSCKPYGSKVCVFTPQTAAGINTYSLIVGSPASNCDGGTDDLVVTLGGQLTITDSWSQTLGVGLTLGSAEDGLVLNISPSDTWGKTKSWQVSETLQMSIPSQRQGALLAQVTYNSTYGTLQIGSISPFPVVANQPQNGVIYVADIIPCNAQFDANYTAPPSASHSRKSYSIRMIVVIASLAFHILSNFV